MTVFGLSLILLAAVLHATWNLLAKRVGGGPPFVWLFTILSTIIYLPVAAIVFTLKRPEIGVVDLCFIVGSGSLHLGYFLLLQQGYRVGDLSLIYPLARGTGPTLSTIAAIAFLGERPSALAIGGALLVVASVFALTGGARIFRARDAGWVTSFGLLTGVVIAMYTLWDKHAVSTLLIPPIVLDWGSGFTRGLLLTPTALRNWDSVRSLWRGHRVEVLGVAVLAPLAYLLVLTALVPAPVSYIAPTREISILVGAYLGARLLNEGDTRRRMLAASGMVAGIAALALG